MSIPVANFDRRVSYAWTCIRARDTSSNREFDNCFENWDGDLIVTALVRHADSLDVWATIQNWWGKEPCPWREVAAKYAHIPDDQLAASAATMRAEHKRADAEAAKERLQPKLIQE